MLRSSVQIYWTERILIINKNMDIEELNHFGAYHIPSPIVKTDLDLLLHQIKNSEQDMEVESEDDVPELLLQMENNLHCQTSNTSDTKISKYFGGQVKTMERSSVREYSKTECKNVLVNIRKPIVEYFNRPRYQKLRRNSALLKFAKSKFVNMNVYQEFFKTKRIKNVLSEMFLSKYLKRAYLQRRTSKINKVAHLHRIRELQRMFIESHKK